MFKIWQLRWRRSRIQRSCAKDYRKLERQKAPKEKFEELDADEYYEVREVEQELDCETGLRLWGEARSLDVETPPLSDDQMWFHHADGKRVWLSSKGRAQVRKLIDEEAARRFEVKTQWVTRLILPLLGLIIGVLGAITSLIAVLHQKK
jgi:hypothetical protein